MGKARECWDRPLVLVASNISAISSSCAPLFLTPSLSFLVSLFFCRHTGGDEPERPFVHCFPCDYLDPLEQCVKRLLDLIDLAEEGCGTIKGASAEGEWDSFVVIKLKILQDECHLACDVFCLDAACERLKIGSWGGSGCVLSTGNEA